MKFSTLVLQYTKLKQKAQCYFAIHEWVTEWYEGSVIFHKFSTCKHCNGISWDAISKIGMGNNTLAVYRSVCTQKAPENFQYFLDKCAAQVQKET